MVGMDRSHLPTRLLRRQDEQDDIARGKTPEELIECVWQLTIDAWAFKGESVANRRMQKDVTRLVRRRPDERLDDN